jgi:hypothetical protein
MTVDQAYKPVKVFKAAKCCVLAAKLSTSGVDTFTLEAEKL